MPLLTKPDMIANLKIFILSKKELSKGIKYFCWLNYTRKRNVDCISHNTLGINFFSCSSLISEEVLEIRFVFAKLGIILPLHFYPRSTHPRIVVKCWLAFLLHHGILILNLGSLSLLKIYQLFVYLILLMEKGICLIWHSWTLLILFLIL